METVNTVLYVLFSLVPILCLLTVCMVEEKEPPSYLDIWYGEDR
jgi:hypothetical protein